MTARGATRIAITIAAIALVGGSLTGCSRVLHAVPSTPVAGVTATSTPAAAPGTTSGTSLQDIQSDLDSATSATSNADGDVTDADNAAATNDSP